MAGSPNIPDTGECATTEEFSVHCLATNYCTSFQACDPPDFASRWDSFDECFADTSEGTYYYLEPEGYDLEDPGVMACVDAYEMYFLCAQQVALTTCDIWADDFYAEPGSAAYDCTLAYDEIYEICSYID
jgi:hypothetical protein